MKQRFISIWVVSAAIVLLVVPMRGSLEEPTCGTCSPPQIAEPQDSFDKEEVLSDDYEWLTAVEWLGSWVRFGIDVHIRRIQDDVNAIQFRPDMRLIGVNIVVAVIAGYGVTSLIARRKKGIKKLS